MRKWLRRILYSFLFLLFAGIVAITLFVHIHPVFGETPDKNIFSAMNLPYYNGKTFTNLNPTKETFGWSDYRKIISLLWKGNPRRKPSGSLPLQTWNRDQLLQLSDTATTAIWYGHSAFFLRMDGLNILLDPMFGNSPSPVPLLINPRFNSQLPIQVEDLPPIDLVVLSHDHYDHLDYGSILKLKEKTRHFLVPLGVGAHLKKWGVPEDRITELHWQQSKAIQGITFTCTPAQHFSGRGLTSRMTTLWCSWVIKGSKHNLFFSGDSGYFEGFKAIGDTHGPFDLCMMECGQYNELWKDIHMMPEETAQAHVDLRGKTLIPIHWGAFTLAMHDWNEPVIRLKAAAVEKNIELITPRIGEPIVVGQPMNSESWWMASF
jgi:L-ascorbate metabolism protein UlaG (beta-lactamase superfamily)